MFNCDQCRERCKNICCSYVPIENEIIDKVIPPGPCVKAPIFDGYTICQKGDRCAYLVEGKCIIYDKRPEVCRLFGNEQHKNLRCPYQDKDGRIRSRQERRQIEREIDKEVADTLKAA